jgi:ABC-2 type transport system permease protein
MRYLRLWITFFKFSLKQIAAYRLDFLFRIFSMGLMMGIMYFVLSLPFNHTESLGGWKHSEVLILISFYYISNGLGWSFFREGIGELETLVRNGDFDSRLIKPVRASFLVSCFKIQLARLGDVLVGTLFIIVVIYRHQINVSFINILVAVFTLFCGVWIVSRIFLIVNALSFWVTETYLNHVANPVLVVAKYPIDIWPHNLQNVFYWVLPVAFLSTVPTAIFLGKIDLIWGGVALVMTVLWSVLARLFWNFAIKHYSSVGS